MPLFYQQPVDSDTKLAIWKIEEEEQFFLDHVPLQREITHPHKRLQHLAGRYLLQFLFPDFPIRLIQIADTRKPFLQDEAYHFSISHSGDFAAVIVSKNRRVGLDLEKISDQILRIRHKFVTEAETAVLENFLKATYYQRPTANEQLTLLWSCKEAVFKWYGLGNVDFRKNLLVQQITGVEEDRFVTAISFEKGEAVLLQLPSLFFDNLCLSYIVT